ncbi:thioesterase [Burkholderia stabilis]|uniref:thioesterase n=1 Tax=Burkholderia stabilis TaxID=95485 RepID=UPI00158C6D14|nr:thioesterase [Burkholderia stabilis]
MRNNTKRAASAAMGDRTMRHIGVVRTMMIGLGIVCAMSNAMAAGQATRDGMVHFTGALVDLYDVTFDAPSGVVVDGREVAGGAVATLRFDAHGRRLPGAHVVLVGPDGTPFAVNDAGSGVRATWRDAYDERTVPLVPGRVHRVGPHGGVMTVAADEATGAAAPVVIRIRHP